ncbi:MAG: NlpC/P60 family protein [Pyrinomonadaceae bacterium]
MSQSAAMPNVEHDSRRDPRRLYLAAWLALWLVLLGLVLYPVSTGTLRALELLCLCGLWAGALLLFWRRRVVRLALVLVTACVLVFFTLPGSAGDEILLRRAYVSSLSKYEGARYVWGGEGRLGIDCSGLVRRGLVDADFRQGLVTMNPRLLRESASLWWHDASAKSLLAGYSHRTEEILAAPSISEIDHARLLPGDVAVTADGLHTLAYLGDETWIEADPNPMRVIKVRADAHNSWLKVPVRIMRWQQFETGRQN